MTSPPSIDCRQARFEIGAEPQTVSAGLAEHLSGCPGCTRFRSDTLSLDERLSQAMQLPLSEFRGQGKRRVQPFALAASIVLALVVAGSVWTFRPAQGIAGELIEHIGHEAASWTVGQTVPAHQVAAILKRAGVQFDSTLPVTYASACPFRGRVIPHLVVQTAKGPLTVMLLEHETVVKRREFSADGYRGVLLPAGGGSVAVLAQEARAAAVPAAAEQVVSAVRW